MDTALCIAAAHLRYLEPSKDEYRQAEMQHFASAVSGLRKILDGTITGRNPDAVVASSFLLYLHGWTSADPHSHCVMTDIHFGLDRLFPMGNGLKSIFQETSGSISEVWIKVATYRPVKPLTACSRNTVFPEQLERSFVELYHRLRPRDQDVSHFNVYMGECKRLVPVLSLLKLSSCGVDVSPLQPDVIRYLFSFPLLFSNGFRQLFKDDDKTVQIVIAHFYVAVSILVPEKFWWAQLCIKHILGILDRSFLTDAFNAVDREFQ
jgi:hypothetical protein